mgnify:CR=1 FL=1
MKPLAHIPIHPAKSQHHRPFLGIHREHAGVSGEAQDENAHDDFYHPFVFREVDVFQLTEKIILVHDSIFLKPSHLEKGNVILLRTLGIKTRAGSRQLSPYLSTSTGGTTLILPPLGRQSFPVGLIEATGIGQLWHQSDDLREDIRDGLADLPLGMAEIGSLGQRRRGRQRSHPSHQQGVVSNRGLSVRCDVTKSSTTFKWRNFPQFCAIFTQCEQVF